MSAPTTSELSSGVETSSFVPLFISMVWSSTLVETIETVPTDSNWL